MDRIEMCGTMQEQNALLMAVIPGVEPWADSPASGSRETLDLIY
jgi:hypothetical protein